MQGGFIMKNPITLDTGKKAFPMILMSAGIALMLALWILRLNIVAVVCVAFSCVMAALIVLSPPFHQSIVPLL